MTYKTCINTYDLQAGIRRGKWDEQALQLPLVSASSPWHKKGVMH
jgi:hypothetical protein